MAELIRNYNTPQINETPEERQDYVNAIEDMVQTDLLPWYRAQEELKTNPDDRFDDEILSRVARQLAWKKINALRVGDGYDKINKDELNLNTNIQEITNSEALTLLAKTEIHGVPYQGTALDSKVIKAQGLTPKYKTEIDNVPVWFSSQPYEIGSGRIAILGYVKTKWNTLVARTFYLSNSQGVWRYLPRYTTDQMGDIDWYDKGYGEDSITLPVSTQEALAKLSNKPAKKLTIDPNVIFAGTCRSFNPKDRRPITLTLEVEAEPKKLDGNFYPPQRNPGAPRQKTKPEEMKFKYPGQKPDFKSKPTKQWEQKSDLYGNVKVEVFTSRDGGFSYMFCRDKHKRVWIGGIEINTCQIRTTGLREFWINGGDLTTPAYEYPGQDAGYGNYNLRRGSYIDVYQNYLSKIPVIQEYVESLKQRGIY